MKSYGLHDTIYKNIMPILKDEYNSEAENIYMTIEDNLKELYKKAYIPDSEEKLRCLKRAILPSVAIYRSTNNYDLLDKYLLKRYTKVSKRYQKYGKMPLFFSIFKVSIKNFLKKSDQFNYLWVKASKDEVAFNITKCYYKEMFDSYKCSNLCNLFCKNDGLIFGTMSKDVELVRKGTIAMGNTCCDFKFKKV